MIMDVESEYNDNDANIPEKQFKERVKDILIDADQIQFGDKLGWSR